jgi:uncharacterized membrane protein
MTAAIRRIHWLRPEHAFALIGLVFGLLFVFANPPWQGNDEDRHFYISYFWATGHSGLRQNGERIGGELPASLLESVAVFQGLDFAPGRKLNKAKIEQIFSRSWDESRTVFHDNPGGLADPLGYAPHIAGIFAAHAFTANPLTLLHAGRIGGLLAYLAIVFMAIRLIPLQKWLLVALALTPMALFQAGSITYDTLCIALAYLLLALVVRFAFRERPVSIAELVLLSIVMVLQRHVKEGYFVLPFLFLLIPRANFGSSGMRIGMLAFICALVVLPRITWDAWVASLGLHGNTELQKDFLFDAGKQLDFYVRQPAHFAWYLLLNVVNYTKEWMVGVVGRFGYAYAALPEPVAFVHWLVLIALSVLDQGPVRPLTLRERVGAAIVGVASAALIVVGFFIRGSPVGARVIFGIQGRYFLPLLPFLLLANYRSVSWRLAESWKAIAVPVYCSALLGYSLVFVNRYFYMS